MLLQCYWYNVNIFLVFLKICSRFYFVLTIFVLNRFEILEKDIAIKKFCILRTNRLINCKENDALTPY